MPSTRDDTFQYLLSWVCKCFLIGKVSMTSGSQIWSHFGIFWSQSNTSYIYAIMMEHEVATVSFESPLTSKGSNPR